MNRILALFVALIAYAGMAMAAVNINSATKEQLESLNGIGPVKAQAIIDYRKKNGAFKSLEDVKKVDGIGDATFDKIRKDIALSGTTKIDAPAKADEKKAAPAKEAKQPAPAMQEKKAAPVKEAKQEKKAAPPMEDKKSVQTKDEKKADAKKEEKAAAKKADKAMKEEKAAKDKEKAEAKKAEKAKKDKEKAEAKKADKAKKDDKAEAKKEEKTK